MVHAAVFCDADLFADLQLALDGVCLRGKCEEDCRLGYELLKRFAHIMEERLKATQLQLLDVYCPYPTEKKR